MRFRSTSVQQRPDGQWQIAGELHAAGHGAQLELTPSVHRAGDRLQIDAQTTIDQHQLGMTVTRFGIRSPATVAVHADLRPAANTEQRPPADTDELLRTDRA